MNAPQDPVSCPHTTPCQGLSDTLACTLCTTQQANCLLQMIGSNTHSAQCPHYQQVPGRLLRACTPLIVMTDEQTGLSRKSICTVHVPFKRKDTRRPAARPDVAGHAPQASPASNHDDNPPRLEAPMLAACITETAGLHIYMLPA
jgi:hypothetical protein